MNITKATIVLGALLSASIMFAQVSDSNQAPAANAPQDAQTHQGRYHRNMDPAKQAAHLARKLGLSNDQVAQLTPILTDRQQQMLSLHSDASLSQQDRRAKAKSIMEDSKSKIEVLLNDTQKQQFEQMLAERRQHHKHQPQA